MKIYFIGICGTATGNVAVLMKKLGHEVAGSDSGMYEPMKGVLSGSGIDAKEGWSPERLDAFAPDLVVVGNSVSRMNPELEFVLAGQKYPYDSLPSLIGEKIIGKRESLVVSGTHGKTTTTSIAAYLLRSNGVDAGWLIGGVPRDLPEGGSNLGSPDAPFVIEGDEYDSAFFDKRSKFLHYRPRVLVINNIEFDHADIFRDLEDVKRTFTHVRRIVSPRGTIIENSDDKNVSSLENTPWVPRATVGTSDLSYLKISDFSESPSGSKFSLSCLGKTKMVETRLCGLFNARNIAMAVAGVGKILGLENPLDLDLSSIGNFVGVRRRQEVILDTPDFVAVEDFAHHPTALSLTIRSLKNKYPGYKIFACFEPRSNTAKRKVLQNDFAKALSEADSAFVGAVNAPKLDKDSKMDTFAMASLYPDKIRAYKTNEDLLHDLISKVEPKTVCAFFSNGSFDSIHKKFTAIFSNKSKTNS